jgi:hypothetical protein
MNERPEASRDRAPVFRRELPGGGYVVIGVERPTRDQAARTCVWIEQRKDRRASDADTPVIAIADGDEQSDGFTELYRLAADNAAVARCLLKWRAERHTEVERAD